MKDLNIRLGTLKFRVNEFMIEEAWGIALECMIAFNKGVAAES